MKRDLAGPIRAFVDDDIPQVAGLYMRVFRKSDQPASPAMQALFHKIFFNNPWHDETMPSLVYQTPDGKIAGFLGVMPRMMLRHGRPVRVAVSNSFMVAPDSRQSFAAMQLLKSFFAGPQDLSLAEGGEASRRIWEALGGAKSYLYSMQWTRHLRPSQYVTALLLKDKLPAALALASRPICYAVDAMAARIPPNQFQQSSAALATEDLEAETLLTCISAFTRQHALRPLYDQRSLSWLLEIFAEQKSYGALQKLVVRRASREIAGWCLYYLKPGGLGEVLQIGGHPQSMPQVLAELFRHAWRNGVVALSGQLEPKFMQEFSEQYCIFRHSNAWMLIHSRHPELLEVIHRGEAFFSRLEGEWMFYKLFD